jgi:hypothetical protein
MKRLLLLIQSDIIQIFFAAACWTVAIYYLIWSQNYFSGVDAYYHVQISEIMRDHGLVLNGFPWADCSVWRDNFFDKEWFFHVFLIPFLYLGKLEGGKTAILVCVFLICMAWGILLKSLKIKHIFFFLILMFCCTGYGFASRFIMCRAHLLSTVILPICILCIIAQRRIFLFFISLIYSLTYVGAWQVIPLALIFDLLWIFYNKQFKVKKVMFFYAFAGILVGILVNPYFPNNLNGLFVQNFVVLKTAWLGSKEAEIHLGNELYPISAVRLFSQFLPYFILLFITCGNLYKNRKKLDINVIYLGILSVIYFFLMVKAVKFSDYSVAVGVTFIAAFWDKKAFDIREKLKYWFVIWAIIYATVIYYAASTFLEVKGMPDRYDVQYYGATQWLVNELKTNNRGSVINPGKIVYTGGWDDAPMLFYGAPQYRYLVFLDPCFMYAFSPEKYRSWQRISDGKALYPVFLIKQEFNADYVFLTSKYTKLAELLEKSPNAMLCYKGPEGEKIFKIEISEDEIRKYNELTVYYNKHVKKQRKEAE